MGTMHTRRKFLTRGLTVLSAATTMPLFLQRTVIALNNPADLPLTQTAMGQGEQILVVIQMSGGNDGLATVAPLDNDDYRRARPVLAHDSKPALAGQGCRRRASPRSYFVQGAFRSGPDGGHSGRRISEPQPLAFPLDGNLADRRSDPSPQGWLARAILRCAMQRRLIPKARPIPRPRSTSAAPRRLRCRAKSLRRFHFRIRNRTNGSPGIVPSISACARPSIA